MTDRDYEIAAEAAEAAMTVRLKLDEIIGRHAQPDACSTGHRS